MDAAIKIGSRTELGYVESHYHGELGGIEVRLKRSVWIGPGIRYCDTGSSADCSYDPYRSGYRLPAGVT